MLPKVTIGIPTYNQEKYIVQAAKSALSQSYENLEVIVVDDSRNNFTGKALEEFKDDHRFRYIHNESQQGRVANYRKILYEHATGEWYVNLDGDDCYCDPDFISNAINSILREAEPVLFYQARHEEADRENSLNVCLTKKEDDITVSNEEYFLKNGCNYFSHLSTLYNRQFALEAGFYELDVLVTDFYSVMRMCLFFEGRVILSNRVVGYWINHEGNASKSADNEENLKVINSIDLLAQLAFKLGKIEQKVVKEWRKRMLVKWIFTFRFKLQDLYLETTKKQTRLRIEEAIRDFNKTCDNLYRPVLFTPGAVKQLIRLKIRFVYKKFNSSN